LGVTAGCSPPRDSMVVLSRRAALPTGESKTGSAYHPPNSPATFRLLPLAYPCATTLSSVDSNQGHGR